MRIRVMLIAVLAAHQARACEAPPPAVADIDANSYYSDSHHSIVDPARKARNEAAVKPVNDYLDAVARKAVAAQSHADDAAARCALDWLAGWADANALLGTMTTDQSYYKRKLTLGGLALSYARVRAAATPDERRRIDAWLLALADATIRHSDAHKGVRNTHDYWEGLAVTATGAVTGDARCLAWGRKVFDAAMAQIRPDGALPYELERAGKALHYHLYAAAPLVLMASIFDVQSPQLDKLIAFSVGGVADPSAIAKMTGANTILIRRMKASPRGLKSVPSCGWKKPSNPPAITPIRTWTYSFPKKRLYMVKSPVMLCCVGHAPPGL